MPVNRNYGGYSGYGGTYSSYVPGMYTSSFASAYGGGARAGSQSPATIRAVTPARTYGANMAVLPEEKNHVLPTTPSTFKYYNTRKEYYTPTAYSRYSNDYVSRMERRTINTDEIDTEQVKDNRREHAIPGEITRDTTLNVKGGKAVVRMVTTKLKESPYVGGGWRARQAEKEENTALTLGQRLALKHQIREKPKPPKEKTPPPVSKDSGEESEWTWETCSSSEAEEIPPPKKKNTPTPPKRKEKAKSPPPQKPLTPEPPRRVPVTYTKSNTTNLCSADEKNVSPSPKPPPRNTTASRWMDRLLKDDKPKPQQSGVRIPNMGNAVSANKNILDSRINKGSPVTSRPISWAGIPGAKDVQDVQTNIHTENKLDNQEAVTRDPSTKVPPPSSSGSSSSPPLYKYNPKKPQTYKGAGSQYFQTSDEEIEPTPGLGRGWRPGQPPRGDVVVKLVDQKKQNGGGAISVINSQHSEALATNRALTSHAAITSRVPASVGDKYQIPGLFIKPSVKSNKPVEAKLTLKPEEGTMSLTTKSAAYQSSIYTPSKSPLLDARKEQKSQSGDKQSNNAPSSKQNLLEVPKKEEPKGEESGSSEWEYYTETEPSDEDEDKKSGDKTGSPILEPVKEGVIEAETLVTVNPPSLPSEIRTDNKTTLSPSFNSHEPMEKKPSPNIPLPPITTDKTLLNSSKSPAKKHPVSIDKVTACVKKKPEITEVEPGGRTSLVSAVAGLKKTKPSPILPKSEEILEDSCGSGPGYAAPETSTASKPKPKPCEVKIVPKPWDVSGVKGLKPVTTLSKPPVTPTPATKVEIQKESSKAPIKEIQDMPTPISVNTSASPGVVNDEIKADSQTATKNDPSVSDTKTALKTDQSGLQKTAKKATAEASGKDNVKQNGKVEAGHLSPDSSKNKEKHTPKNTESNHAKETAVAPETVNKKYSEGVTEKSTGLDRPQHITENKSKRQPDNCKTNSIQLPNLDPCPVDSLAKVDFDWTKSPSPLSPPILDDVFTKSKVSTAEISVVTKDLSPPPKKSVPKAVSPPPRKFAPKPESLPVKKSLPTSELPPRPGKSLPRPESPSQAKKSVSKTDSPSLAKKSITKAVSPTQAKKSIPKPPSPPLNSKLISPSPPLPKKSATKSESLPPPKEDFHKTESNPSKNNITKTTDPLPSTKTASKLASPPPNKSVSKVITNDPTSRPESPLHNKSLTKPPSPITKPRSPEWSPPPSNPSPPPSTPQSLASPPAMTTSSLERLPTALKDMFKKTENTPKEKTNDSPSWFDNVPKENATSINMKAMNEMKADANRAQVKKSKDEANLIMVSSTPETPWYDDEDDDMKELLKNRPTILREIDQSQDRRLTPEENMAVIKMYGGVMFPGGSVEKTPKSWLFRIRKALRGNSAEKKKQRDSGTEFEISCRPGSTSSNSSSISSFTGLSKSPSPDLNNGYSDSEDDDKEEIFKNPKNEAPTKYRPAFKKYGVKDFRFLKVLGKGSFGKVLLTELRGSQNYYAVKALKKDAVLEDDDIECTMIERKVLALGVKHPFLCHLFCTFQTDSHLFFVMEYLNGGDLMFHIQQQGRFDTERARFYSAEIVCALKFLHRKGIVYRDLKLDNLLLDYEGHIRIVDFGMCKLQVYLDKTADTFCGTPDYMAPEIIKGMKYTHSVDWWSFGVLLYEMLIGQSPFNGCDEDELFWSICNEQAYFPRFLSKEAKQLLLLLLEKNPASRLGVSDSCHGDIKRQPFFRCIDFTKLEAKQILPPYKPKLRDPMDVSYFDTAFTEEPVRLTPIDQDFLEQLNQTQFKGFSYTNMAYTR